MQQQADTKSSATLILGCGYIGTALAHDLAAQGKRVVAVKRDVSQQPFVHPNVAWRQGDVTQAEGLPWEEGPYTDVVYSVSSSHGDSLAYEKAYVQGLQSVMPHLKPLPSLRRFVYLSSTGVYGQNEGQWVDESMPADPPGKNPQLLVQAENLVLEASQRWGIPGVVLRLSGIYGPNRCHALQRLLSGMVQLELPGDRWVNMIHQQDVVRTILATFIHGPAGSVFNVSDDCPVALLADIHCVNANRDDKRSVLQFIDRAGLCFKTRCCLNASPFRCAIATSICSTFALLQRPGCKAPTFRATTAFAQRVPTSACLVW